MDYNTSLNFVFNIIDNEISQLKTIINKTEGYAIIVSSKEQKVVILARVH